MYSPLPLKAQLGTAPINAATSSLLPEDQGFLRCDAVSMGHSSPKFLEVTPSFSGSEGSKKNFPSGIFIQANQITIY